MRRTGQYNVEGLYTRGRARDYHGNRFGKGGRFKQSKSLAVRGTVDEVLANDRGEVGTEESQKGKSSMRLENVLSSIEPEREESDDKVANSDEGDGENVSKLYAVSTWLSGTSS